MPPFTMSVPNKRRLIDKEIQVMMAESTDSEAELLDDGNDSSESSSKSKEE